MRRLGQGKVVSSLLLQSHEPACSRIGACFAPILHDTTHLPELPTASRVQSPFRSFLLIITK